MQKGDRIEIIARAAILHRGKILLCKRKVADYFFLPGGHVEFGESIPAALSREIKEELGVSVKKIKFLAIAENIFKYKKYKSGIAHEINFLYQVSLKNNNVRALEKHLTFEWVDLKSIGKRKILPEIIKKKLRELV